MAAAARPPLRRASGWHENWGGASSCGQVLLKESDVLHCWNEIRWVGGRWGGAPPSPATRRVPAKAVRTWAGWVLGLPHAVLRGALEVRHRHVNGKRLLGWAGRHCLLLVGPGCRHHRVVVALHSIDPVAGMSPSAGGLQRQRGRGPALRCGLAEVRRKGRKPPLRTGVGHRVWLVRGEVVSERAGSA